MCCLQLRRASCRSWPLPSVECRRGLFTLRGEKVHDTGIKREEEKEKRENLNYEELYNLTPSIHGRLQHARLNSVCVNDFRHIAVWFVPLFSLLVSSCIFQCVNFTWSSEWHGWLRLRLYDTHKTKILLFLSHHTTQAFFEWRNHYQCNTDVMLRYPRFQWVDTA